MKPQDCDGFDGMVEINEDNKYKNDPTTSWTREEALTEEGLAFGVPYWDQVSKTEDLQIIDN